MGPFNRTNLRVPSLTGSVHVYMTECPFIVQCSFPINSTKTATEGDIGICKIVGLASSTRSISVINEHLFNSENIFLTR